MNEFGLMKPAIGMFSIKYVVCNIYIDYVFSCIVTWGGYEILEFIIIDYLFMT